MALPKKLFIVPDGSTNAALRSWAQNVSDLIANTGMTKVATVGEIDFTTVQANTSEAGFQIWHFADALQATAPVYFRIGYGGDGVAAARPSLYLTVGANVSGNTITTVGGAAPTTNSTIFRTGGLSSTSANIYSFAAGNTSALVLFLFMVTANTNAMSTGGPPFETTSGLPLILSIERTHDANGADTNAGVMIFGTRSAAVRTYQQVYWDSLTGMGTAAYEQSPGTITPATLTDTLTTVQENKYANQIGYFPNYFTKAGGVFVGPSLNILATMQDGPGTVNTYGVGVGMAGEFRKVNIANANHNYLCFAPTLTGNVTATFRSGSSGNASFMMRYE